MPRTLDPRTLEPGRHPEMHPDIHTDVHPDVDDFIRRTLDEHEAARAPRRPVRWMRWLAAGFVAVVGIGVAIWALQGDQTEYAVPRTADGTERWLEYSSSDYAVPRTADGAEGWLTYAAPEYAVPTTADGTVRWMTYTTDFVTPRTADGSVLWFEHLTARVPQSADGFTGWLDAVAVGTAPVRVDVQPITQVPDTGQLFEIGYLPVTQPTPVVPGEQVVLAVQPILQPAG